MTPTPSGAALPPDWTTVEVSRRASVADDIALFELRPASGRPLPPFTAGAHIDVRLPGGAIRQYSLCNDPAESDRYELAIQREPAGRGGSQAAHAHVDVGTRLEVGSPRNLFALQAGRHAVLLAGGIGITPLMAMAAQLTREERSFELHYSARSTARMAFRERLAEAPFAWRSRLYVDDVPSQRFDAARHVPDPAPETHAYVCGPGGYMDHVVEVLHAKGWADAHIHLERFSAPAERDPGDAFEIQIGHDGPVIAVPAGQSVAAALAAAGHAVPLSCEQGICGTCATRVLAGVPDHQDMFLTEAEKAANDRFTPCCSRSRSARLVIDLAR
ncbi:MAG: oxidoreductase [Rhodocyclaceae bacterium]|nr:oxidoreductase [Rhodocyclaceae bacterium]